MDVNLDTVQADMEVYGSDGEKIGQVAGVERQEDFIVVGSGPDAALPAVTRFVRVKRPGFLEIGGGDLHIPESAIRSISFGDGVMVDCTKDECIERYQKRPNVL